jgi:CHASE2 domain-containing sensor protein
MSNAITATQSKTQQHQRRFRWPWQVLLTGGCLAVSTLITGINSPFLEQWERQVQTLFFEYRGPQPAPDVIVILAIDDESLAQAEHYRNDPTKHAALEPIQQWPWKREAYAVAIERLMQAGAKAVAFDILFATESAYGPDDDKKFISVLEKYGDHIALAMKYDEDPMRQGLMVQPTLPLEKFRATGVHLGTINFPRERDGRIHDQGYIYLDDLEEAAEVIPGGPPLELSSTLSFAEATLQAAEAPYEIEAGTGIHFHGPAHTFKHIPFWYVMDPDLWENHLQSGAVFRNKIVIIGSTAEIHQDFHDAPFSKGFVYRQPLSGVEILANDLDTLRVGSALLTIIPSAGSRALFVFVSGTVFIILLTRLRRVPYRLMLTAVATVGWVVMSYIGFSRYNLSLPTAGVASMLLTCGGCYSTAGLIADQIRKQRLRSTLAQYATSPIVQEIISQEEEFHDLLEARKAEVVGTLLGARYQVLAVLGYGGFSETYTASDTQRPGNPVCVVKRLRIVSDDPKSHELAHRLFSSEARTLEKLGHHNQIPRLLAHFETSSSFYLVEEMIQGVTLKEELSSRQPKSQAWVMSFLLDILPVVDYVHSQGVIHRDIKPSNLIRRAGDGRLVLIDFGSVKEITHQLTDPDVHVTSTIGIGTKGYMPSEQSAGMPRFNSDLYAIGVTAIEALTGVSPYKLNYDDRGELIWQYLVPELHPALGEVISKMVRYSFDQRYEAVNDVLAALREIPVMLPDAMVVNTGLVQKIAQQSTDDDDRWDEPTGYLPTDWATDTEKENTAPQ